MRRLNMDHRKFRAGVAMVAALVMCGASPHAATRVRQNLRPPDSGPSFVIIPGVRASSIKTASDGAGGEWFGEYCHSPCSNLVRLDEKTFGIQRFTFSKTGLQVANALALSVDGSSMWFTYYSTDSIGIGYIDLQTHGIKKYKINKLNAINDIVAGPDNSMWFTFVNSSSQGRIGRIDLATNKIYAYFMPGGRIPYSIVVGSDGALWFTEDAANIGRIDPASHHISEYATRGTGSNDLTNGPDNAIWFTTNENNGDLGRLDLATHSTSYVNVGPHALGPIVTRDADLWFVIEVHSRVSTHIGKYALSSGVSYYTTPIKVWAMTVGADDELWAAGYRNKMLKICPDLGPTACATYGAPPRGHPTSFGGSK
jgi:virginiamycin B lyase